MGDFVAKVELKMGGGVRGWSHRLSESLQSATGFGLAGSPATYLADDRQGAQGPSVELLGQPGRSNPIWR